MTLTAADVSVTLAGRSVLDRVSIAAGEGQLVAVLGPNAAGKSTLLRVLAGLLRPTAGRVEIDGAELTTLNPRQIGRSLAYLPQDRTVAWPLAAATVVALGRRPHTGFAPRLTAADHAAIDAAMHRMDVQHLANRPVSALSGGERARVLIARALAQDCPILVADEPIAGLDPAHQLGLCEALLDQARRGRTVIAAMHELSLAIRYATHVVMLRDGAVAASGPITPTLTPANIGRVFGIEVRIDKVAGIPVVVPLAIAKC